jgi:UDP-N-acetylglucosamine 1-carboxyvinyltransferase
MARFIIEGGRRLKGELTPQGAKNEALQIICATLLTSQQVTVTNIPEIQDVLRLVEILRDLGVKISHPVERTYTFQAEQINLDYLSSPEFFRQAASLRGSIMILGPLLARYGVGCIPQPGGDKIGRRRLDTHFRGFEALGAEFTFDAASSSYKIKANKLTGCYMLLDEASLTGTANLIMAASLAQGTTTIYNAACEY